MEDSGSGLGLAGRYCDVEALQFRHEDTGLGSCRRRDAGELFVSVRVLLLEDADVTLPSKRVDATVGRVPDHLVATLGSLEGRDGSAGLSVQHNQLTGLARNDKKPLVGLVEGNRRVLLRFLDGPGREHLEC